MQIVNQYQFEQNVDRIFASYLSEDFIQTKMQALGSRNIEVAIRRDGRQTMVTIHREMPAQVPSTLKKFIDPWNSIRQVEVWHGEVGGPYYCDLKMDIVGAPVKIKSQVKLAARGEGSAAASITDISCSIPFIGKLLTSFLRDISERAVEEEFAYISEHC